MKKRLFCIVLLFSVFAQAVFAEESEVRLNVNRQFCAIAVGATVGMMFASVVHQKPLQPVSVAFGLVAFVCVLAPAEAAELSANPEARKRSIPFRKIEKAIGLPNAIYVMDLIAAGTPDEEIVKI